MICSSCQHLETDHDLDDGCTHGWTYGPMGGPALTTGCTCPWTLARYRADAAE